MHDEGRAEADRSASVPVSIALFTACRSIATAGQRCLDVPGRGEEWAELHRDWLPPRAKRSAWCEQSLVKAVPGLHQAGRMDGPGGVLRPVELLFCLELDGVSCPQRGKVEVVCLVSRHEVSFLTLYIDGMYWYMYRTVPLPIS